MPTFWKPIFTQENIESVFTPSLIDNNAASSIDNNTRQPYLYRGGDYIDNYVEQLIEI